ncbi:17271_t:CDS:1, partial [Racocetra persica]
KPPPTAVTIAKPIKIFFPKDEKLLSPVGLGSVLETEERREEVCEPLPFSLSESSSSEMVGVE